MKCLGVVVLCALVASNRIPIVAGNQDEVTSDNAGQLVDETTVPEGQGEIKPDNTETEVNRKPIDKLQDLTATNITNKETASPDKTSDVEITNLQKLSGIGNTEQNLETTTEIQTGLDLPPIQTTPPPDDSTTPTDVDGTASERSSTVAAEVTTSTQSEEQEESAILSALDELGVKKTEAGEGVVTTTEIDPAVQKNISEERMDRLSEQIRKVISNYKEYGTVTIPGSHFPDPMSVPNIKKTFAGNPMSFTNVKVYGLSNFTVNHINTDLDKMQIYVALDIKRLVILGNYSVKSWISKASGPFNVTLIDVEASGAAQLIKDDEGHLQASETDMDMTFMDARVDFKNLGMMGSLLQGVLASVAPILFDAIKPNILQEVNTKTRSEVNKKIRTISQKVASSGTEKPLDRAVIEGRKFVKESGYDPYQIKNYVLEQSGLKINISNFWLIGLSRFYRVGDISLSMDSGTIQFGVQLITKRLYGKCVWTVSVGDAFKKKRDTNITVEHIHVKVIVNQSLDTSQRPILHDLDLNVGKPRIQMHGAGQYDVLFQYVVNSLPGLLRHIIVDALEEPIKYKGQEILNRVNVEDLVKKHLPDLDRIGL